VFYGHGAYTPGNEMVGINPSSGGTVRGTEIQTALGEDANPPTLVVLGACGSEAILGSISGGGVPVAVGLSEKISNAAGATAVATFMQALSDGQTFGEAQETANALLRQNVLLSGGAELVVHYGPGYDSSMTLEEARAKHRTEAGAGVTP